MAAGTIYGDEVAPAAEGLGDSRVCACPIEDNMRGDAPGEHVLLIEMAHAAEVALAFLAYIAHEDERRM